MVVGTAGAETLRGTLADELVRGLAGSDTLSGGGGIDTLEGGAGNDIFVLERAIEFTRSSQRVSDFVQGEDRIDVSELGISSFETIQNIIINDIDGNAEITTQTFGGSNSITIAGFGSDTLTAADFIFAPDGNDRLSGTPYRDDLFGGGGNDSIFGGNTDILSFDGSDRIFGGAGNDTLAGGEGNDTLIGGPGADFFVFEKNYNAVNNTDLIFDFKPFDASVGGERDRLDLASVLDISDYNTLRALRAVDNDISTLTTTFENATNTISLGTQTLFPVVGFGDGLSGFAYRFSLRTAAERLEGTVLNDDLIGGLGNDTLVGLAGADSLYGEGGNDVFELGEGNDFVYGGNGNDVAVFLGNSFEYTVSALLDGTTEVTDNTLNRYGTDILKGVERIEFANGAQTLPGSRQTSAGPDFNNDNKTDFLWYSPGSQRNAIWHMGIPDSPPAGTDPRLTVVEQFFIPNRETPSAQMLDTGDFNGDGNEDILWFDGNNSYYVWNMNGSSYYARAELTLTNNLPTTTLGLSTIPGNQVQKSGDFDGDGNADILWRNTTTGALSISLMNGPEVIAEEILFSQIPITANDPVPTDPQWQIKGIVDYNNDGFSDILWRNNATGANSVGLVRPFFAAGQALPSFEYELFLTLEGRVNQTDPVTGQPIENWDLVGAEDFNYDGQPDLIWRDGSSGDNGIWLMNPLDGGRTLTEVVFFDTPRNLDGSVDLDWQLIA